MLDSISLQSTIPILVSSTAALTHTPTPLGTMLPIVERDNKGIGSDSSTNSTSGNGGIAAWEIALIATFTTLLFVSGVVLAGLVLAVIVYRRWKVEQMKRALLEIRPAHLAIGEGITTVLFKCFWPALHGGSQHSHLFLSHADNATYDLTMQAQDYRLYKIPRKGRRLAKRRHELSTASENLYECPYDEVYHQSTHKNVH